MDLQGSEISDDALAHLANLPYLKRLHLGHTQVTAAGLRHLVGLKNLADLDLSGSQVVLEDAIVHLKKLTGLRWLDLRLLRGRSIGSYIEAIDELKASLPSISFHELGLRPYLVQFRNIAARPEEAGETTDELTENAAPDYVFADVFEDQMPVIEEHGQYYEERSGLLYFFCGIRRCGVVDKVPGYFFVATVFLHVFRVPPFPLDTYLYRRDGNWEVGFPISPSLKSVLIGWANGLLGLVSVIALLILVEAVIFASGEPGFLTQTTVSLVVLLVCGGLFAFTRLKARPTPVRAEQLARKLRMPSEQVRKVREIVETGRWSQAFQGPELVRCANCSREIAATTRICPRCEMRQF